VLKDYGNDLKKLRESKGVSIAEISAETRINPKFINFIESGKFDFQPDTYIRSFLKEYARAIGENEKKILNDYDKAKAGFYSAKKVGTGETKKPETQVTEKPAPIKTEPVVKKEPPAQTIYQKNPKFSKPDYMLDEDSEGEPEFTNRSITQKILLVLLMGAIAAGIYFLIDYLNNSGNKKSDIKPKSFNEMSSEYENKVSGKKDSVSSKDSLKTAGGDSLRLVIKAIKDIRVIVVTDDDRRITGEIVAKDSIIVSALKKFKFSSSDGPNTELYLNGKYVKKPVTTRGSSIKDMMITKEGIRNQ